VLLEANGQWLDISDEEVYTVAADSFGEVNQQFRRVMVSNPFVEGSFNVLSVKENVNEVLSIYVRGCDLNEVNERVLAVTGALSQPQFKIIFESDGKRVIWNCWTADFTVVITHEFRHARYAQIRAQIPRLPAEFSPWPAELVRP
jgi:hypothetical protein